LPNSSKTISDDIKENVDVIKLVILAKSVKIKCFVINVAVPEFL